MLGITLVGSLVAGSMRFQSMETRLSTVEIVQSQTAAKLDSIVAALARIEGKLEEQDRVAVQRRQAGR